MTKQVKEGVQGKPLQFDLEIDGVVIPFQLVCPMCGNTNFAISHDHTLGGCTTADCPGICLERLRDVAYEEGVQWVI